MACTAAWLFWPASPCPQVPSLNPTHQPSPLHPSHLSVHLLVKASGLNGVLAKLGTITSLCLQEM